MSIARGRTGRYSKPPPQFGQTFRSIVVTHASQKVHSKLQIIASDASGGRALPHASQDGRSSSMAIFQVEEALVRSSLGHERRVTAVPVLASRDGCVAGQSRNRRGFLVRSPGSIKLRRRLVLPRTGERVSKCSDRLFRTSAISASNPASVDARIAAPLKAHSVEKRVDVFRRTSNHSLPIANDDGPLQQHRMFCERVVQLVVGHAFPA